jgi:MATE family multidrug resistance protein
MLDLTPRFFRLALINIASSVTVPLVGLVDTAMLGHLPDIRFLAGVALAAVLFDYLYWTLGFLRMSTTGLTAQAFGREDRVAMAHVLYRAALVGCLLGVVLVVLQLPIGEAGFAVLSGEPQVETAGRDYFAARIWGAPATMACMVLIGWYLGRAQSREVLVMTVAANLANVLFNYIFIMRLGWAARGAGVATALSQYLMLAVGLAIFMRNRTGVAWRWSEVLDRKELAALFRLNRDILLRTLCLVSSFALFTNSSSILGTLWLVSNSILMRLLAVASYLIDGAAYASESLAGIYRGRRDGRRMRRLFRLSLATGLGFALLFLAAVFATMDQVLALLTSHADVRAAAAAYAPWLLPVLLFGSLAYMYDGLFLGLTEGRRLRNAMLVSTFAVFLPACGLALWQQSNPLLWLALTLFMAARTATLWAASRAVLAEVEG